MIHNLEDERRTMPLFERLAVQRIKRWLYDRTMLSQGRCIPTGEANFKQQREQSLYDARLVRCIDFERTLETLAVEDQVILLATYREGLGRKETAALADVSERTLNYKLPIARQRLGVALDKLGLL